MKKLLTLILGMLSVLITAFAQEAQKGRWDGNVELNAGTSFVEGFSTSKYTHSVGDVSAWGRYTADKFTIRLDLQCMYGFEANSVSGSTVNVKDIKAPQASLDIDHKEYRTFEEKAGLQVKYTPDQQNEFSFSLGQKFNRQVSDKFVILMQNHFSESDDQTVRTKFYFDIEQAFQNVAEFNADAKWHHKFDKTGREILSGLEWNLNGNDRYSEWCRLSGEREKMEDYLGGTNFGALSERVFRITPLDTKNGWKASVLYRDVDIFDLKNLNLEIGGDFRTEYENDRLSAANYVNEQWVDSLRYCRTFDYLSMDFAPSAKLSYCSGKFDLNIRLTPDVYMSRLGSDRDRGRLDFSKIYLLSDLYADWKPSPMHKAGITYKQGLVRPSYSQLCGFRRMGSNANEILMGNPDLKPSGNGTASLFYTLHSGFFTGTLEGIGKITWDRITKVFKKEDDYSAYTWINSAHSFDNSIKLTLKADMDKFNAEIGGYYNYFIGYDNAGGDTRSSDWGVNGNASLKIKGGWMFNIKGRYQSKIIRTYSSITEYVGCDVRVSKDFKRFSVYLEGKDLFDQPIMITTYSEDKTYARFEEHFYNRRLFAIGAAFKF